MSCNACYLTSQYTMENRINKSMIAARCQDLIDLSVVEGCPNRDIYSALGKIGIMKEDADKTTVAEGTTIEKVVIGKIAVEKITIDKNDIVEVIAKVTGLATSNM